MTGEQDIAYLRSARAVRERGHEMLALARAGALVNFSVDESALPGVAERVVAVTRAAYPDVGKIPFHSRWRHFGAGGIDLAADFQRRLAAAGADAGERLRAQFDLVITSVLLDAGAGATWMFREPGTGVAMGRSEGLAIASYHWFVDGDVRAGADRLERITEADIARAFQVSAANPLVGTAGRAALLQRLGAVVRGTPRFFGAGGGGARVGHLGGYLVRQATQGDLPATTVLETVLEALGPIWPGRHSLNGVNLGDVWPHPKLGLVPFHKLSQWLTYSLLEPLQEAGVRVTGLDELTGLAEYRNGGLFIDGGVLVPRHPGVLADSHAAGSDVVVEWRALTVALLDRVAEDVRRLLGMDARTLPLAKILEGGTWATGRELARERRPDASPPIRVMSDGTVF